ncbi:MAG: hypothetical protein GDA36_02640 [Rhodobacteraceae bacterium]|nr:hypothetical protein [Paracoccaceae bacterium]
MGKAILVIWLCDCRCLRGRFCPIAASASRAFCFGQPELSGGASSWQSSAQSESGVWKSAYPRVVPRLAGVDGAGSMTGGRTHDPVTVATAQVPQLTLLA